MISILLESSQDIFAVASFSTWLANAQTMCSASCLTAHCHILLSCNWSLKFPMRIFDQHMSHRGLKILKIAHAWSLKKPLEKFQKWQKMSQFLSQKRVLKTTVLLDWKQGLASYKRRLNICFSSCSLHSEFFSHTCLRSTQTFHNLSLFYCLFTLEARASKNISIFWTCVLTRKYPSVF